MKGIVLKWDSKAEQLKIAVNLAFRRKDRSEKEYETLARDCLKKDQIRLGARKRLKRLQYKNASTSQLQKADSDYKKAQRAFLSIKKKQSRLRVEVQRAQLNFDLATKDYKKRIDELKEARLAQEKEDRAVAIGAGVPEEHLKDITVVRQDGVTHIYFGGIGPSDGQGHGHYILDDRGKVFYERLPFRPHGRQNYIATSA